MEVILTEHGEQRVKDRVGVSKKIADKVTQKALEKGIQHCETVGSLKRYMDKLYFQHRKANNMRIFNRKVYIFNDNTLITILDLPSKYHNTVDKINKRKAG